MDIYQKVTDSIVAQLEKGVRPWAKGWSGSAAGRVGQMPLRANGERYSGVNVLILWTAAMENGYSAPTWMTYKQATALGGQVRKGEKSEQVVFASTFEKQQDDGNTKRIPFLKNYSVFNVEQIDGLPAKFTPAPLVVVPGKERFEAADAFFDRIGADIRHGGDRAFYSPQLDYIKLPDFDAFTSAEGYYGTKAHELVHWSGAEHRLDRLDKTALFGSENYSEEELVAEIGAAFVMALLGIASEPREDHASYIASWLVELKNDKRLIVKAASAAEKATKYLAEKARFIEVTVGGEMEQVA